MNREALDLPSRSERGVRRRLPISEFTLFITAANGKVREIVRQCICPSGFVLIASFSVGCCSLPKEISRIDISDIRHADRDTLQKVLIEETAHLERLLEQLPNLPIEEDAAAVRVKQQQLLLEIMQMRLLSQFFEQRLRDNGYTPQSDEDPSYSFTLDQLLEDLAVEEESEE